MAGPERGKTVLVIDDDSDFVGAVTALLESVGHVVRSASTGPEGLRLAVSLAPDLVLLDVMMSEPNEGYTVLKQIRAVPALARTPVVMISSIYTEQPVFQISPEAGWVPADLFLPKPVEPGRLLSEIARLTARTA